MLNPAQYTKIAQVLFKEQNPWEKWENADQGLRLAYLEQAEAMVELLYDAGFSVIEGGQQGVSDDPDRGGPPSQK